MILQHLLQHLLIEPLRKRVRHPLPVDGIPLKKEMVFRNFVSDLKGLPIVLVPGMTLVFFFVFWGLQILIQPLLRGEADFFLPTTKYALFLPAFILSIGCLSYGIYVYYGRIRFGDDWPLFIEWATKSYRFKFYPIAKYTLRIGLVVTGAAFLCVQAFYTRVDERNIYLHKWPWENEIVLPVSGINRTWCEMGQTGKWKYFVRHNNRNQAIELSGETYGERLEAWQCLNWLSAKRGLKVEQVFNFFR